MDIELSRDLQNYRESVVMGLNAQQFLCSVLALGTGAGMILALKDIVGITAACYLATPVVAPIALSGFYSHNGMGFWKTVWKMIYFSLFNRPLLFFSTENVAVVKEAMDEEIKEEVVKKKGKDHGKEEEFVKMKRKAMCVLIMVGVLVAVAAATVIGSRMLK